MSKMKLILSFTVKLFIGPEKFYNYLGGTHLHSHKHSCLWIVLFIKKDNPPAFPIQPLSTDVAPSSYSKIQQRNIEGWVQFIKNTTKHIVLKIFPPSIEETIDKSLFSKSDNH